MYAYIINGSVLISQESLNLENEILLGSESEFVFPEGKRPAACGTDLIWVDIEKEPLNIWRDAINQI